MFSYGDASQVYAGELTSGFGIDFAEVKLDGSKSVRELQIDISGMQGGEAEFNVQVWKLTTNGKDDEFQHDLISVSNPELLLANKNSDIIILEIPAEELEIYDRLGFVTTRLDMGEVQDPVGGYTINLVPVGDRKFRVQGN